MSSVRSVKDLTNFFEEKDQAKHHSHHHELVKPEIPPTDEIKPKTNHEFVASAENIRKYEASKKLSTIKTEVKMKTNAITVQEKYKFKVVEARMKLHTTLLLMRFQEHKSFDGLQYLESVLPDSSMLYNQAIDPILHIEAQHSSRMLTITAGAEAADTESLSYDLREKKIQIDRECDASIELVKTQVAEANKLTSGTKNEIKGVALMQKVAENSQGDFQPEVMAMLNKELTPKNSSLMSKKSYKRMCQ